jgi:RND superfamily putative drug exporter
VNTKSKAVEKGRRRSKKVEGSIAYFDPLRPPSTVFDYLFPILARLAVTHRRAVIAFWAVAAALAVPLALDAPARLDVRGDPPPGTEAAAVDSLLRSRFSRAFREVLVIPVESPESLDGPGQGAILDSLIASLSGAEWTDRVISWRSTGDSSFVRADRRGTVLFVLLRPVFALDAQSVVEPARAHVRETLARLGAVGWSAPVTGEPALEADLRALSARSTRQSELRLAPVTFVVLVFAFGALVAAALPVAVAFLAIVLSLGVIGLIARFQPVSIYVLNIASMLGLGVGIDYSLLVVNRFREELRSAGPEAAATRAARKAGRAIITSGATVLVGFGALLLTPIAETRSVGLGGMVVVLFAVAVTLTLLPALLAVIGHHIDRPRWLARVSARGRSPESWTRWAALVMRRPWTALIAGLVVVTTLAWPARQLRIGLPARHWWPAGTESAAGLELLDRMGMGAVAQPIRLTVGLPDSLTVTDASVLRGLQRLGDSLAADPRVEQVRSLAAPGPARSILALSMLYSDLDQARLEFPDFVDAYRSSDGRVAVVDVILRDSVALVSGMAVVRRARVLAQSPPRGLEDATIAVGGFYGATVDLQDLLMARFPGIVALVLGVIAVMLMLAFRAALVPLKAVVLNLLSVAASFGLMVWVFQLGRGSAVFGLDGPTEAIFAVVPVLVFAIVFGLSMDYEVFLLARVKEEWDAGAGNEAAVARGLAATAGTITWAAAIMVLVFGAFAFSGVFVVQVLGFGLAAAVLLDATIIRLVLAPALMRLAGKWNWWPARRATGDGRQTPQSVARCP